MGVTKVKSPCKSTIIFTYENHNFDFETFSELLENYFYYSICLVAKNDTRIFSNANFSEEIDDLKLQKDWREIKIIK